MHVALCLHAHLPYVRHLEHPSSFEERWLFEALWECYLPIVELLSALGSQPNPVLTLSVSPTLLDMLADRALQQRFVAYLDDLGAIARRWRSSAHLAPHAAAIAAHEARISSARAAYEALDGDVVGALVALADKGTIELATTTATHAYLPGLKTGASVRAQLRLGVRVFEAHTRRSPQGIWLPECAFEPRLGSDLALAGARFTVLDAHGLDLARPRPPFDVYAPIVGPEGVAFFGREPTAARRVWSRQEGYPGDPIYREFHRDLAFQESGRVDASDEPRGRRPSSMTGIKPWAITGSDPKVAYDPLAATARAHAHALDFVAGATSRLRAASDAGVPAPIIVAPFDAELFGHWWFEGPTFLAEVLRELTSARSPVSAISLGAHLDRFSDLALARPAASTWGEGGFGDVWTHPESARLWRHVHHAEIRVLEIDAVVRDTLASDKTRRARLQAIKELMLLQSSDWAFMLRQGEARDYASSRVRTHASRIERLTKLALTESWSDEDTRFLASVEAHTPLFAKLDEDAFAHVFDPW